MKQIHRNKRVCVCVCLFIYATVFNRVFHLSVFVHFRLYKQREPLRVFILRESFKNLQNVVMKIIFVKFQKCGGKKAYLVIMSVEFLRNFLCD